MRQKGVVTYLSRKRNFVFIVPEGEERRVFCHRTEILGGRSVREGLPVEFEIRKRDRHVARRVRVLEAA